MTWRWCFTLAAALLFSPLVLAAPYTAVVLAPPGVVFSRALGAADGKQVGWMDNPAHHAVMWSGSASSFVDLHPAGYEISEAWTAAGGQQGGYAQIVNGGPTHAMIWNGSAASFIDLHSAAYFQTNVIGTDGTHQVGGGTPVGSPSGSHPLLWSGTAASAVDLTPTQLGFDGGSAEGVSGAMQVGAAALSTAGGVRHAMLWSGTAAIAIDLSPAGAEQSDATGIAGNQEVGFYASAATNHRVHAVIWNGTAASMVDINPITGSLSFDYAESEAKGTNGTQQVGYAVKRFFNQTFEHAIVWNGSANDYVDLGSLLPPNLIRSFATGIDGLGNVSGYAQDSSGNNYAVAWIVPEPTALGWIWVVGVILARRARTPRPEWAIAIMIRAFRIDTICHCHFAFTS